MKKYFKSLLAIAVVASGCAQEASAPPPTAAASRPSEAKSARATKVDTRDLNVAEAEYQSQVNGNDKDVVAKINLGVIKERKWDNEGALKVYQDAVKTDPKNLNAALALARVLTALGKGEMAEKFLLMSKKANGELPEILNGLASVSRQRKKYPEAVEYAKKVLLRDQDNIDALNNIALVYLDQGKFDSAELYAQTAVKRAAEGTNTSSLYVTLGMIQYKRGDIQRSMAQFNKALSIDGNNGVAHQNLGLIALAYRDYDLATKELDQAYGLGVTSKEVSAGRCYALEGLKKGPDAANCLTTLVARLPAKDPELPGLLYSLGMVHMNLTRDQKGAIAAFKRYTDEKENLSKTDRVFELIKSLELQQSAPPKAEEAPEKKPDVKEGETPAAESGAKAELKPSSKGPGSERKTKRANRARG